MWVAPVGAAGVDWDAAAAVTDDTDRGIRSYAWARDGRHLLYVQDTGGDENWRLYDVDATTLARRDLTPFDGVQARIIATRKSHRDEVLVGINRDNPELHDVYRLDLKTGDLTKLIDNPGYAGWLADEDMVVRGAINPLPDGGYDVLVRDDADGDWRTLLSIPADDAPASDVLAFTADGKSLLAISAAGVNTGRLVRIDLATGDSQVLLEDPDADVSGVILDPDTREPQIAEVDQGPRRVPRARPGGAAGLGRGPGAAPRRPDPDQPGRGQRDLAGRLQRRRQPGALLRLRPGQPVRQAAVRQPPRAVCATSWPTMEPFSFTSRDGLTVHGYVTFPPGGGRAGLPAVLDVHGGPTVRDEWGWNPEAQWLANRGYLCIQVNYRGSTGYGKAFVNAGDREWGGKMHDDLIDAVGYVVAQGWADPDRVAIYGGSYGGYAALLGAAFTPDVFCCAVDIVGPSNLQTLLESIPPYWAPAKAELYKRVGNPETDQEFLWSRSPLSRARDIRIPLLIAQGANDPRVKQAESEQIVAALAEAGIDHEYMLFPDEGHGFAKPENRLKFYAAAERFLAKYLGGRFED